MDSRTVTPGARSAVFATLCTLLAVAAHMPASHQDVPLRVVGLGAVAVFGLARCAAAFGERGLGSITVLVGVSQLLLHEMFRLAQNGSAAAVRPLSSVAGPGSVPGMDDMLSMADMPGMGMPVGSSGAPLAPMGTPPPMGASSLMTIAHLVAALATAWWLRRGEAAVFAVVRQAGALLAASWRLVAGTSAEGRPAVAAGRGAVTVPAGPCRSPHVTLLRFVMARRGPPALCR